MALVASLFYRRILHTLIPVDEMSSNNRLSDGNYRSTVSRRQ